MCSSRMWKPGDKSQASQSSGDTVCVQATELLLLWYPDYRGLYAGLELNTIGYRFLAVQIMAFLTLKLAAGKGY